MREEHVLTPYPLSHPSECWKNFGKMQSCEGEKQTFSERLYVPGKMLPHLPHHLDMTHFKRLSRCIALTVRLQVLSRITTR